MIRKPARTPCWLNKSHLHAEDLSGAFVMNDSAKSIWNFNRNCCNIAMNVANWGPKGIASRANDEYGDINNTDFKLINSDNGTILFFLKSYASFTDGANHRVMGGTATPGYLYMTKNTSNRISIFFNNGTTTRSVGLDTVGVPNWLTGTQIAFRWRKDKTFSDGNSIAINVDGIYKAPSSESNATALDTYDMPTVFSFMNHHSDRARYLDAVISYMYIYNRALNDTEMLSIFRNPYAMFYTPKTLSTILSLSSAGGGIGSPYYYYPQQIGAVSSC